MQPPYRPPYPPQHSRRVQWEVVVFTLLLGLVLVMLTFLYRSQVVELAQAIAPRCFVGIQGTAASITVIGFDADRVVNFATQKTC